MPARTRLHPRWAGELGTGGCRAVCAQRARRGKRVNSQGAPQRHEAVDTATHLATSVLVATAMARRARCVGPARVTRTREVLLAAATCARPVVSLPSQRRSPEDGRPHQAAVHGLGAAPGGRSAPAGRRSRATCARHAAAQPRAGRVAAAAGCVPSAAEPKPCAAEPQPAGAATSAPFPSSQCGRLPGRPVCTSVRVIHQHPARRRPGCRQQGPVSDAPLCGQLLPEPVHQVLARHCPDTA